MPTAEAESKRTRAQLSLAQFRQIVERCAYQLELAHAGAQDLNIPFSRLQRYKRAQREIAEELKELKK